MNDLFVNFKHFILKMSSRKRDSSHIDSDDSKEFSEKKAKSDSQTKETSTTEPRVIGEGKSPIVSIKVVSVKKDQDVVGPRKAYVNLKEWSEAPGSLYCGRGERVGMPGKRVFTIPASPFRNPFVVEKSKKKNKEQKAKEDLEFRQVAIQKFAKYSEEKKLAQELLVALESKLKTNPELQEIQLGCWCKPLPCHCDVLIQQVVSLKSEHLNLIVT